VERPRHRLSEEPLGPYGIAEGLLHEIRDDTRELARAIRGHNGEIGLVAKVHALEEWMHEVKRKGEAERNDMKRLKLYADERGIAKWKAFAIWGGVALAVLGALVDAYKAINGGG
jgi:hypothetical protein